MKSFDKKFLTVGIPTFNSSKYLINCIKSVINLETVNEVIISDDCSNPTELKNIEQIISQFNKKKSIEINFIKNKENLGAFSNKYNLIQSSTNKYIYVLDSDNIAAKNLDIVANKILNSKDPERYLFQPNTMYQFWNNPKTAKFLSQFDNKYKVRFFDEDSNLDLKYVQESLIANPGSYDLKQFSNYKDSLTTHLKKDHLIDKWVFWILNCGNFIVSTKKMKEIAKQGFEINRELRSVDAIVFSYLWLKAGNEIKIFKDFYHHHRKRNDSVSFMEKEASSRAIRYFINEVLIQENN